MRLRWDRIEKLYAARTDELACGAPPPTCKRVSITGNWQPPPAGVAPNPPSNLQVQ
jgi:hypothetical protein